MPMTISSSLVTRRAADASLCDEGMTIAQGITAERALLYQLRVMAQDVVNTTDMLPMQLRAKIRELFGEGDEREGLAVTVYSFGFKHAPRLMPISLSTCVSFRIPIMTPRLSRLRVLMLLFAIS